jgi:signal transduction histidine kinase
VADRLGGLREWARGRRPAGIRVRVTATAVAVVGIASVVAAFAMIAFVGRSLTAQAADQATVRAEQIADGGVTDGRVLVVADPEEQFVQVLRGSTVVASSANVAGLPALAVPGPESVALFQIPTVAGPFIAASAVTVGDAEGPRTVVVGLNIDDVDEARHLVALALLFGVPLLLVVVGLVTWRMVGRTLRPVEDMREEVERISSTELDRRVPTPSRDDEVGRLARTMNRMLDRLQRGQERQRRFISDASHELRSPVAAIRQHAEVALAHPDSSNLRELADVVLAEDARLQDLVEDLLVLARLDEHARPVRFDEVDLDDVVLADAARLRSTTSLAIDTQGVSTARILGQRADLERLVRNLTDNAIHHARGGIWLGVGRSDGHVALTVDDDGPGIASADRERVLERFVRLDGARGRATGGSGLGLSIVREVAVAHQGAVTLGRSPQGGLHAEVRFPAE